MAILTVTTPGIAGADPNLVAANSGGDSFPNTGIERLRIRNTDENPHDVTIEAQQPMGCPAGLSHDVVITVPAGEERTVRGFAVQRFNDTAGRVNITYDAATGLLVGVER